MSRFFSTATFIIPILFAPLTVLILLSQNTVPGNLLYPYKRGLEVMILAAASLNPTTGAYFHTNLSDRRYTEAESLLVKNDISGLSSFIDEVTVTQLAIDQISDPQKKQELNKSLIEKIDSYQTGLTKVQTQVAASPTPFVTLVISTPTVQEVQKNPTQPTKEPTRPVPTDQPTRPPSVQVPPPSSSAPVAAAISQTQEQLKKIKEKVQQREEGKEKDDKSEEKKPEEKKSRVDKDRN